MVAIKSPPLSEDRVGMAATIVNRGGKIRKQLWLFGSKGTASVRKARGRLQLWGTQRERGGHRREQRTTDEGRRRITAAAATDRVGMAAAIVNGGGKIRKQLCMFGSKGTTSVRKARGRLQL
ncbi:hypothetical protein ACFE04_009676 [Oxalis oulophora]